MILFKLLFIVRIDNVLCHTDVELSMKFVFSTRKLSNTDHVY